MAGKALPGQHVYSPFFDVGNTIFFLSLGERNIFDVGTERGNKHRVRPVSKV